MGKKDKAKKHKKSSLTQNSKQPQKRQKKQIKPIKRQKKKINTKRKNLEKEKEQILEYYKDYIMTEEDLNNLPKDEFECYETPKTKEEHQNYLQTLIFESNIILEVLDARNPKGMRIPSDIEQSITNNPNNKLVIILNKIDLISQSFSNKIIDYFKRQDIIVIPVSCYHREKIINLYSKLIEISNDLIANGTNVKIGIIGYPNVGKSSLIHSLKLMDQTDKTEKYIYLNEDKTICLNSTYVHVFSKDDSESVLISKAEKEINDIINPIDLIKNMFNYVDVISAMEKYNIAFDGSFTDFFNQLCNKFSKVISNSNDIIKIILNDIINGKIKFEIF